MNFLVVSLKVFLAIVVLIFIIVSTVTMGD